MRSRELILPILLLITICLTGCGGKSPSSSPASGFRGGTGAENDPYLIYTAAQLDQVRTGLDKCYKLMADIDLVNYTNWTPIGPEAQPFSGHFDGNNFTIRNLTVNHPETRCQGLFGRISTSELTNINLLHVNVTGSSFVGSLVGISTQSVISNCSASGTGTITSTNEGRAGGLIGENFNGSVNNSHATLTTISSKANSTEVGGLIGRNSPGTVNNCYASGNVTGDIDVGGLIGMNAGTVTNCYATGTATALSAGTSKEAIGGLIGWNYQGTISQCHATGNVSGVINIGGLVGANYSFISRCFASGNVNGTRCIGGLAGSNQNNGDISNSYAIGSVTGSETGAGLVGVCSGAIRNCYAAGSVIVTSFPGGLVSTNMGTVTGSYYDTTTSGQNDSGKGEPKSTDQMKAQSTFAGWDFTAIWNITTGYPFLQ